MAGVSKAIGRLQAGRTMFLLCDMQEKFRPSIQHFDDIAQVSHRLVQAAKHMKIPIVATEQYPKGLGNTVSTIDTTDVPVFAKTKFSMMVPDVKELIAKEHAHVDSFVIFGIETQVCISQTTLDLLGDNHQVHVVADACSSRNLLDRKYALKRLRQSGAFITTSEALLFELLGGSKHPNFKEVQALVKDGAPVF
ncbi:isochorismatase domain-containing protein 1-like [Sycon ciliatum]|uniref:isochorismatase domain-containing protein 1-like n=1 Tax=Sycon ciliatum TaxID=27933 RepID=UPI0031F6114C|eukprot:scpid12778/ scgid23496/ Isochorismatase domain-containing protein 1